MTRKIYWGGRSFARPVGETARRRPELQRSDRRARLLRFPEYILPTTLRMEVQP